MNRIFSMLSFFLAGLAGSLAHGAEIKLYPTGPAEDSAFVRFVNGTAGELRVTAPGSPNTIELRPSFRASPYMSVAGRTTIRGELARGTDTQSVSVELQPGQFVTVLGLDSGTGLEVQALIDDADDFTAVRVSIGFYSLSESCGNASIEVAGREVLLFENVQPGKWVRRQLNPVPLSVQLLCSGRPVGQPLDMGALRAGERHSLFLVPGDPAQHFFHVKDELSP